MKKRSYYTFMVFAVSVIMLLLVVSCENSKSGSFKLEIGSPASGDVLGIGNKVTVSWTSSSNDYVKIEISYDNKESWNTIAESVSASIGIYEWIVEGTPSNDCYLRITNIKDNSYSKEVGPFSVGYILAYTFKDIISKIPVPNISMRINGTVYNSDNDGKITVELTDPADQDCTIYFITSSLTNYNLDVGGYGVQAFFNFTLRKSFEKTIFLTPVNQSEPSIVVSGSVDDTNATDVYVYDEDGVNISSSGVDGSYSVSLYIPGDYYFFVYNSNTSTTIYYVKHTVTGSETFDLNNPDQSIGFSGSIDSASNYFYGLLQLEDGATTTSDGPVFLYDVSDSGGSLSQQIPYLNGETAPLILGIGQTLLNAQGGQFGIARCISPDRYTTGSSSIDISFNISSSTVPEDWNSNNGGMNWDAGTSTLTWDAAGNANEYLIKFIDGNGNTMLVVTTQGTSFTLPDDISIGAIGSISMYPLWDDGTTVFSVWIGSMQDGLFGGLGITPVSIIYGNSVEYIGIESSLNFQA